jgi:tetratricopeptide (TPR) repeat protein
MRAVGQVSLESVAMTEDAGSRSGPSYRAMALFEKGDEAARRNNFDYAVDMFTQALKLEPQNLRYRGALRAVERKRYDNDPSKVGWMAATKAKTARMGIGIAKSRGKWAEVIDACEEVFKHSPWDVHAARDAAEAAEHLGFKGLAKWLLESVFTQAGEDAGYMRHLGHVYELHEEWEKAIACWEKVRRMVPGDEEAMRKSKDLAANATITRSGLDSAMHKVPEGRSGPDPAEQSNLDDLKKAALSPEERLRKQIDEEPTRIGPYLELAELLKRQNKLDEAERVLAAGKKVTDNDPILVETHADLQIARLQRAVAVYGKKVRDNPGDTDAKAKLEQITGMLADYELKEYRRRLDRRPEDQGLRLQLGSRLAKAGRHDEAIVEFQQVRNSNNTALKVQALYQLGLCFEAKGLPKLAERNYQEALKLVEPEERGLSNALHYRLGRAAETQGDLRAAEEHYNEVAANDYGYEDVAARLENLNRKADL